MPRDRSIQVHSNGLVLALITQEPQKRARYSDRWVCDESWYQLFKNDTQVKRANIVKSLHYFSGALEKPSNHPLHHCEFVTRCPHDGKKRRVQFFYLVRLSQPTKPTQSPSCGLMRNATTNHIGGTTFDIDGVITPASTHHLQTPAPPTLTETPALGETPIENNNSVLPTPQPQKLIDEFDERPIYWESPVAAILFGFEHGDDVVEGLHGRIMQLKYAVNTCNGYCNIVDGNGEDLSHNDIFDLRTKSLYLINAYDLAIDRMGRDGVQWVNHVFTETISAMQRAGVETIKSGRTLANWNIMLRTQGGSDLEFLSILQAE